MYFSETSISPVSHFPPINLIISFERVQSVKLQTVGLKYRSYPGGPPSPFPFPENVWGGGRGNFFTWTDRSLGWSQLFQVLSSYTNTIDGLFLDMVRLKKENGFQGVGIKCNKGFTARRMENEIIGANSYPSLPFLCSWIFGSNKENARGPPPSPLPGKCVSGVPKAFTLYLNRRIQCHVDNSFGMKWRVFHLSFWYVPVLIWIFRR